MVRLGIPPPQDGEGTVITDLLVEMATVEKLMTEAINPTLTETGMNVHMILVTVPRLASMRSTFFVVVALVTLRPIRPATVVTAM